MSAEFSPDSTWFKKEFLNDGHDLPIPFMRRDLMVNQTLGYTDGQHNKEVLYPINVLQQLAPDTFAKLLKKSGVLIDSQFTQNILNIPQPVLKEISQSKPGIEPIILIGSGIRYLYVEYCKSLNEFLPHDPLEYFRACYQPDSSDLDFRTNEPHLHSLKRIWPIQSTDIIPSRTCPDGKKLNLYLPKTPVLEFLSFPVSSQIISHLYESVDYPEGIFATVNSLGELLLQDPFGARIMQPFYHSPPYPDQFENPAARLRAARNAIRAASLTEITTPKLVHDLLNIGASVYHNEFTDREMDDTVAESFNESFLGIIRQGRIHWEKFAKVLAETRLLHNLICSGIKTNNIQVLTTIYWLASELFAHLPVSSPQIVYLPKFYKGHVSLLSSEELIDSCYDLLNFHSGFFANMELDSNADYSPLESIDNLARKRRKTQTA